MVRIQILEGHVNYPLLRGAGAGVFMLVGAAYDGRRSLFPGSPSSPTRRHPAASNCALPFERKGLAQGTAAQEEVRKEEEEELSPPGAWKDAGSLPAPGRAPRENDSLFSKGEFFLIAQPCLYCDSSEKPGVGIMRNGKG